MKLSCVVRSCLPIGFVIVTAALAPPVVAQVTWTASTGTGVMYGLAKELVYNTYNGASYIESELDWDIKPLVYAQASLTMGTKIGFVASLDARVGVPAKTGQIGD